MKKYTRKFNEAEFGAGVEAAPTSGFDYEKDKGVIQEELMKAYALLNDSKEVELYPYTAKEAVKEVEYKSRDGFMSFIDGGFSATGYTSPRDLSEMTSFPIKKVAEVAERWENANLSDAKEEFIRKNPELAQELGDDKINYHDLYAAGYGEKAEELSEIEMNMEDDDAFQFEIRVIYYAEGNSRSDFPETDSIHIDSAINWEAPYYRSGKDNEYIGYAKSFKISSKEELKSILARELPIAAKKLFKSGK